MSLNLDTLYQDVIREHAKEPRCFGALTNTDHAAITKKEGFNPLCGDHVIVEAELSADQKTLSRVGFTGQGCSICMASASIAMQESEGRAVTEVLAEIERFRALMQGQLAPDAFDSDVKALAGVQRFPVRIKCALLGWMTLREALQPQTLDPRPITTDTPDTEKVRTPS